MEGIKKIDQVRLMEGVIKGLNDIEGTIKVRVKGVQIIIE